MNEELRRPATPTVHSPVQMDGRNRGSSKLPWVVLLIVVAVIIVVAIMFRDKWGGSDSGNMKASEYQAVFLTNGQVYFGKMANSHETYVTLKDIYYLQVQNPAIQGSQQEQAQAQAQPQLSLVKLGNELHGPVDEMHINRDQILFFEDMKADGKVAQAIKEYKANPAGSSATPPAAPAPAPAQQTPPAAPAPAPVAPTPTPTPAPKPNTNTQQ